MHVSVQMFIKSLCSSTACSVMSLFFQRAAASGCNRCVGVIFDHCVRIDDSERGKDAKLSRKAASGKSCRGCASKKRCGSARRSEEIDTQKVRSDHWHLRRLLLKRAGGRLRLGQIAGMRLRQVTVKAAAAHPLSTER